MDFDRAKWIEKKVTGASLGTALSGASCIQVTVAIALFVYARSFAL